MRNPKCDYVGAVIDRPPVFLSVAGNCDVLKLSFGNAEERIICQLVGMGCPDICVATLVYQRILEKGEATASVDMMQ